MTEQIALRFPEGTRDRIKDHARDGETMTAVVLRALAALEGQGDRCRPDDAGKNPGEPDSLSPRLMALEARVEALERVGSFGWVAFETQPFETAAQPDSPEPNGAEIRSRRGTWPSGCRLGDARLPRSAPSWSGWSDARRVRNIFPGR